MSGTTMAAARRERAARHVFPVAKRVVDVLASLLAIVFLAPLMIFVALLVRASMGSPVLFRQPRVGRGGRTFVVCKFRTMRDDRSPDRHLLPDGLRTPAVGRCLRRFRVDELPQLWNVLNGNMSLIGPRPLVSAEVAVMGEGGRERAEVRPGLTGWAQVHGGDLLGHDYRDVAGLQAKLALDLWYVRHASWRVDLEILRLTARTIVLGERIRWDVIEEARAVWPRRR